MPARKITIDPITRLEGHGKIEIFLDNKGNVEDAFWQVTELRGFERFCIGRPAEEMTRIAPNICGVCPSAHHMAASKALDDLYSVEPTTTAKLIRQLEYNAFYIEDHYIHFFFLAAPDFVVGPDADPAERNILGVIRQLGKDIGSRVIEVRKRNREIIKFLFSKAPHPEGGLPGGVPRGISPEDRKWIKETADYSVEFAQFAIDLFKDIVLRNKKYLDMVLSDAYSLKTYYMSLVDENNKVSFYDGIVKVIDPKGNEFARFKPQDYIEHIAEWVEPWNYIRFTHLKKIGWKGLIEGNGTSLYRVAEHNQLIASDPLLTSKDIRNMNLRLKKVGIGCVEAPRGTLFHHYETDNHGILTKVNLIVATQNNAGPISLSVKKAAKEFIKGNKIKEGLLNRVEMAFRAYDPCLACATHALPGQIPLTLNIRSPEGVLIRTVKRP